MKRICLFCGNGMSTSILASKMQAAADKHLFPIEVKAYPYNKIGEVIETLHPDCILLGPQVKYLYEKTVKDFEKTGIPIAVIDAGDYGMMKAANVLKTAIKLIKGKNK